jgi:hypothetical protein
LLYSTRALVEHGRVVYKGLMDDPAVRSFSPSTLGEAVVRRLYRRAVVTTQITVPAVPSMIDEYVKMCGNVFAVAGVQHTAEQAAQLKTVLEAELAKAYRTRRAGVGTGRRSGRSRELSGARRRRRNGP